MIKTLVLQVLHEVDLWRLVDYFVALGWAQREAMLRARSMEGLTLATEELCKHLDDSVETFKREVAEGKRQDIELTDKAGIPIGAPGYDPTRP